VKKIQNKLEEFKKNSVNLLKKNLELQKKINSIVFKIISKNFNAYTWNFESEYKSIGKSIKSENREIREKILTTLAFFMKKFKEILNNINAAWEEKNFEIIVEYWREFKIFYNDLLNRNKKIEKFLEEKILTKSMTKQEKKDKKEKDKLIEEIQYLEGNLFFCKIFIKKNQESEMKIINDEIEKVSKIKEEIKSKMPNQNNEGLEIIYGKDWWNCSDLEKLERIWEGIREEDRKALEKKEIMIKKIEEFKEMLAETEKKVQVYIVIF
jgi:hypothetical protein